MLSTVYKFVTNYLSCVGPWVPFSLDFLICEHPSLCPWDYKLSSLVTLWQWNAGSFTLPEIALLDHSRIKNHTADQGINWLWGKVSNSWDRLRFVECNILIIQWNTRMGETVRYYLVHSFMLRYSKIVSVLLCKKISSNLLEMSSCSLMILHSMDHLLVFDFGCLGWWFLTDDILGHSSTTYHWVWHFQNLYSAYFPEPPGTSILVVGFVTSLYPADGDIL